MSLAKIPGFPPNRRTLYKIRQTMHHQWMLTLLDEQKVNCTIYMDQAGEPGDQEVLGFCGMQVYQQWLADLKSRSTIDINHKLLE